MNVKLPDGKILTWQQFSEIANSPEMRSFIRTEIDNEILEKLSKVESKKTVKVRNTKSKKRK